MLSMRPVGQNCAPYFIDLYEALLLELISKGK